jgi:pyruvate,water dikinase
MTSRIGLVLTPDAIAETLSRSIGGKAENLWRLGQQGFRVPPWFVVTARAFREAVCDAPTGSAVRAALAGQDLRDRASAEAAAARATAIVAATELPGSLREEVLASYRALFCRPDGSFLHVAVRSSGVGEDAARASFAGQHDTFLFVRGEDSLLDAVRRCWASAFGARALAYRALNGLDPLEAEIAVIVQRMVMGDVSGVLFTANPLDGRRDEIVINATWGLGEGIVSGALDTDSFIVPKGAGSAARARMKIVEKPKKIAFDEKRGEGTCEADVPEEDRTRPCLTREEVKELVSLGERVEAYYGRPQDIEFAFSGGALYLLQARPITTLPPEPAPGAACDGEGFAPWPDIAEALERLASGRDTIWDNSNITESYSGVTSPLTFSFASQAYYYVYLQFCEVIGVPPEEIRASDQVFRNMLGLLRGRVYYNLRNWYKLLTFLPGYRYNAQFMGQMMGLRQAADAGEEKPLGFFRKQFVELPRTLFRGAKLAWRIWRLDAWVAHFQKVFRETYARYRELDFASMPLQKIVDTYHELEARLLWNWKAPIINDFAAMVFYGTLRKLVARWVDPEGKLSVQNDLLCGEGGIESTEPTREMIRLALRARASSEVAEILRETPDERCLEALEAAAKREARPAITSFLEAIYEFLDRYGDRCMNELKLEEKNLEDDPKFVFAVVKNYLRQKDLSLEAMEAREREVRSKAEAKVAEALAGRPIRRWIFRKVLANARKAVKNRENMRFARTRVFGLLRRLFRGYGEQLRAAGVLDDAQDVFYLELGEIHGLVKGTATCWDARGLAAVRRAQVERWRREPIDDRFATRGAAAFGQTYRGEAPPAPEGEDPSVLRGVSCCPGKVAGKARVILSPEDDMRLEKEILVAERTDPGWVPLYPSASGLLIERGSALSHSAIVARELGLPTIVGIRDLTKRVKDGDMVEMDAGAGIARVLRDRAEAARPE